MFISWAAKIKKCKSHGWFFTELIAIECCWLLIWPSRADPSGGSQLGWANWEKQTQCRDKSNWKNVVDTLAATAVQLTISLHVSTRNIFRRNLSFFLRAFNSFATVTIANLLCIQMSACNLIIFEEWIFFPFARAKWTSDSAAVARMIVSATRVGNGTTARAREYEEERERAANAYKL